MKYSFSFKYKYNIYEFLWEMHFKNYIYQINYYFTTIIFSQWLKLIFTIWKFFFAFFLFVHSCWWFSIAGRFKKSPKIDWFLPLHYRDNFNKSKWANFWGILFELLKSFFYQNRNTSIIVLMILKNISRWFWVWISSKILGKSRPFSSSMQ